MEKMEKYVFFWSGTFSQWKKAPMIIDGVEYNCCEQWMMHQKALTFNDTETAELIMETKNPMDQKALGRSVKNFNKTKWESVCVGIVFKGNMAKFTQNPELAEELLSTGDKVIVEASPFDTIWGIGMSENDPGIEDPSNWKGLNLLGWSIMLVRNELRNEQN